MYIFIGRPKIKLLCCATCNEVFNLSSTYRECTGGHGGGQYIDGINAKVWGPKDKVFVLGFANSTLVNALRDQTKLGDREPTFIPGYGIVSPGREFDAFVIPESAPTLQRVPDRFIPLDKDGS